MKNDSPGRRTLLKQGSALLLSLPIYFLGKPALAGKASKIAFHYQDHPRGEQSCSACVAFIASANEAGEDGNCRIVDGPISPNGWCMAFTRKPDR